VDWKTLLVAIIPASITSAGSVWALVKTQSTLASVRDADRQHERDQAYEQRAWELKNAALTTVIDACYDLLGQAQLPEDSPIDTLIAPRRARVVKAMERFRARVRGKGGVMGQLLAYAADTVCKAVDELLEMIEPERNLHVVNLLMLSRMEPELDELRKEMKPPPRPENPLAMSSMPVDVMQRFTELNQAIARTMSDIGDKSKLDVERVAALCSEVIETARNDLRAKAVNEGPGHRPSWGRRLLRSEFRRTSSRAIDSG
jgi:hypothetical protein